MKCFEYFVVYSKCTATFIITMFVLMLQAIRKLEQVVAQRALIAGSGKGGKAVSSELLRKDHELRKLRGDLEKERSNTSQLQRHFRQELMDIQAQMSEEQQTRRQLQKDLLEREDQIARLQKHVPIAAANGSLRTGLASNDMLLGARTPSPSSRDPTSSPTLSDNGTEAPPKSVTCAKDAANAKTGMCYFVSLAFPPTYALIMVASPLF